MSRLPADWARATPDYRLLPGSVDVWRAGLDQAAPVRERMFALIDQDERRRADRFYFERDRTRFIVGRGILRTILGHCLDVPPEHVVFAYDGYGKPELSSIHGASTLRFNVSHSAGVLLIALTRFNALGVDVERIRAGVLDVAERVFSAGEVRALRALPAAFQTEAFFRCWTCKEAFVKACGRGLSMPLDAFDVSFCSQHQPELLGTRPDTAEAAFWSIHDLAPAPGYIGALAVRAREVEVRRWDWTA